MGICNSCESATVATAKIVFLDGAIREFASPVKVSHALDKNPAWFVCSSDEMEFDGFISAVDDDEELRIGQLYFALPVSWLARRLRPEDMASLAVKASSAFKKGGGGGRERGGWCCGRRVDHLVFFDEKYCKSRREVVARGRGGGGGVMAEERIERSRNGNNDGRRRKLTKTLSMITEE